MRTFLILILGATLLVNLPSCSGSKKARQAAEAAEALKMKQKAEATEALMAIINDNGEMSVTEMEMQLQKVKSMGLDDPEVTKLIAQAEEKIASRKAAEEKARLEMLEKAKLEALEAEREASKRRLESLFNDVVNDGDVAIEEALEYFSSDNAPVLTIVSKRGDKIDYDKPTTIRKYLEYLKDQQKNLNYIESIVYDDQNKVKELTLMRTNVLLNMNAEGLDLPPTKEGELDPIRKMAVDSLALEKVRDLGKYIHIIGSKDTPFSEAKRAIERATELFEEGSTMEVSSLRREKINSYPIEEYFNRLMSLNYDQVDITWTQIKYLTELEKLPNGKYMGVITTYQYFQGKSGGELRYQDRTKKDVTVYVEGKETQIGGRLIDFWDVLLGDIKVSETVPGDVSPLDKD